MSGLVDIGGDLLIDPEEIAAVYKEVWGIPDTDVTGTTFHFYMRGGEHIMAGENWHPGAQGLFDTLQRSVTE